MQGSCSGCPSSTATLKHGIQNLLRHFVPDVVEVRPECNSAAGTREGDGIHGIISWPRMRVLACARARNDGVTIAETVLNSIYARFSIDTALAACAAAVYDTNAGVIASESPPMIRGHAEALMPLIARVVAAAAIEFSAPTRSDRRDGGAGQLHRPPRRRLGRARNCAGVGQAGNRHDDAAGIRDAACRRRTRRWSPLSMRATITFISNNSRPPAKRRTMVAPRRYLARRRGAATGRRARYTSSAMPILVDAVWPADERPPSAVEQRPAPDIGWVATRGRQKDTGVSPKPLYLRAPDAQPQDDFNWPTDDKVARPPVYA